MRLVLASQPPNLVYLLLYLQAFEVVELWFMTLKCAVHVVFSSPWLALSRRGISLENDNSAALVSRRQQIAIVVELHTRNYVRCTSGSGLLNDSLFRAHTWQEHNPDAPSYYYCLMLHDETMGHGVCDRLDSYTTQYSQLDRNVSPLKNRLLAGEE